jgi:hypothetical protein
MTAQVKKWLTEMSATEIELGFRADSKLISLGRPTAADSAADLQWAEVRMDRGP